MPTTRTLPGPLRRLLCHLSAGLLTAAVLSVPLSVPASATDFPNKPITFVVPFAAGGSLDVLARMVGETLREGLGQPVLIANRPGAGSIVGARAVASAPADGYTLFITSGSAYGYAHRLVQNLSLRLDDFVPVASIAVNPSVIVASTGVPADSLAALVRHVQANPGAVSFCSTGVNGLNHLQLEMLKAETLAKTGRAFEVIHVPYNGVAPALIGIRRQEVQACTLPYTALVRNLHGKELRILAVQSPKRLRGLPDVPTTGEQGFPEMNANEAYINIAAPRGTPADVVARLESALRNTMADPVIVKRLQELEIEGIFLDQRQTGEWLAKDVARWEKVISAAGLKPSN